MQTIRFPRGRIIHAALALFALCAGNALAVDKTGQQVVEQVCVACHGSGKDGAPRIGDVGAWTQHAKNGLGRLAENAISGLGKMPAHGGQASLTDLELSRAIAYMVSAGQAVDPGKAYASPRTISPEQLVQEHCVKCHGAGLEGAPRLDDFGAWKPRLQAGVEALVRSSITGHKAMPSRAGLSSLSDTDMRDAVTYMLVQSVVIGIR
jgi:cytochrome c5